MRFTKYVKLEENCYQSAMSKLEIAGAGMLLLRRHTFWKLAFLRNTWHPVHCGYWNCRMSFPGGSNGKELACNAGDLGLIPGFGRFPEGGHGNPLQHSCLENPHGQRSLWATVQGHKESDMTEQLSMAQTIEYDIWHIFIPVKLLKRVWYEYLHYSKKFACVSSQPSPCHSLPTFNTTWPLVCFLSL